MLINPSGLMERYAASTLKNLGIKVVSMKHPTFSRKGEKPDDLAARGARWGEDRTQPLRPPPVELDWATVSGNRSFAAGVGPGRAVLTLGFGDAKRTFATISRIRLGALRDRVNPSHCHAPADATRTPDARGVMRLKSG